MRKCLFLMFLVALILSSCVSEKLVISRFKKEVIVLKADSVLYTTKIIDKFDVDIDTITSRVADISYYSNLDGEMKAILHMENGQELKISVANGMLNDPNLVGRKVTWHEQSYTPVYKNDTVFTKVYDTVYVSNLVCQKKMVKNDNYIIKVYDYITEGRYKLKTDKSTFDALIAVPPFAYISDEYGYTKWRSNAKYCIPWDKALKLKGVNNLEIKISPTIYDYRILEQK